MEGHDRYTTPNRAFIDAAEASAKRVVKDRQRKNTEAANERRRRSKYTTDDTTAARSSYSRHDDGTTPEEVTDDITPEHLENLKDSHYTEAMLRYRKTRLG